MGKGIFDHFESQEATGSALALKVAANGMKARPQEAFFNLRSL